MSPPALAMAFLKQVCKSVLHLPANGITLLYSLTRILHGSKNELMEWFWHEDKCLTR
jgi:hypothetical protein